MKIYEVTVQRQNGDWYFWRGEYVDFQAACQAGIDTTINTHPTNLNYESRLFRVELVPDTTLERGIDWHNKGAESL